MDGAAAEDAALSYLQQRGLKLLDRNARFKGGELDLVMRDGETLVIIEVRARRASGFASAAESVDARKQARIIHASQLYLAAHPQHAERALRFDVVAIDEGRLQWLRGAFDGV